MLVLALLPELAAEGPPLRKELHFQVNPSSVFVLNNQDGTISVRGVAGRQATVVAVLHSNKVEVDNSQSGNRVAVASHVLQNSAGREGQVDYDVSVPTDSSLNIYTQAGSISVSSFPGNLDVESETARIELRDVQKIHANLRSLSGAIVIADAREVSLDITCSGGSVELKSVTGPVVSVSTSSGSISYTGLINDAGEYSFITHSGDITLTMPAEASVDLIARSVRGSVENDFPLDQKSDLAFTPIQGRSFAGTSNSAASSVQLQTFNGRIRVKKQ